MALLDIQMIKKIIYSRVLFDVLIQCLSNNLNVFFCVVDAD